MVKHKRNEGDNNPVLVKHTHKTSEHTQKRAHAYKLLGLQTNTQVELYAAPMTYP